ncbi:hypothetical protein DNTS_028795 [Danionella cerebrum]|uniref:Ig-like domain-containing protein n=1 Tax=Danionella cerebrum TaxID=2873325 RepID=A0A553NMV6_9TELE|nr:hypothetical protein DNTS_028795 [Danionella translucida]
MSREEDDGIVLQCQLNDYYPNKLTVQWLLGDQPVEAKNKTLQNTNTGEKTFTHISQLSVSSEYTDQLYTCKASHESEEYKEDFNMCAAKSLFKPSVEVKIAPLRDLRKKSEVTVTCIVKAPDKTKVSWWADSKPVKNNPNESKDVFHNLVSNLTLSQSEWFKWKTIVCTAEHPCFSKESGEIQAGDISVDPLVLIRRPFPESAFLECVLNGLPSGEVCIVFLANNEEISGIDCLDWAPSEKNDPSTELGLGPSVEQSGSQYRKLMCSASGFNPKIKWLSEATVKPSPSTITLMEGGQVKVFSEMLVPQKEWNEGVTYTCQMTDGDKTENKTIDICEVLAPSSRLADIYLLGPSPSYSRPVTSLYLTCLVIGHSLERFSVHWKVNGKIQRPFKQDPQHHVNGSQSTRSILEVSGKMWNEFVVFTCEVKHFCSTNTQQQNISKTRDPKKPTVRILRPADIDLFDAFNTSLLCLIFGFFPSGIFVEWTLNGTLLNSSQFTNSPVVAHPSGGFSMHSSLMIPVSQNETGMYSCVVSHESSQVPVTASVENIFESTVHTAPLAELLQSVNGLVCLASAFSPPSINITWLLGMSELPYYTNTKPAKDPVGKYFMQSHLPLLSSDWVSGEVYTCKVSHVTGIQLLNISKKAAIFEEAVFVNENKQDLVGQDSVEEVWNMAFTFLSLFLLSLLYGCTVTLFKAKPE